MEEIRKEARSDAFLKIVGLREVTLTAGARKELYRGWAGGCTCRPGKARKLPYPQAAGLAGYKEIATGIEASALRIVETAAPAINSCLEYCCGWLA